MQEHYFLLIIILSLLSQTSDEYDSRIRCVESNFPFYNPNSNSSLNKTYFDPEHYSGANIPSYKDWRDEGVVTGVKDQVINNQSRLAKRISHHSTILCDNRSDL